MITCDLIGQPNEQDKYSIINFIFEKLFSEFNYFKTESNMIFKNPIQPASLHVTISKSFSNLRRQLVANISNLCKLYSKELKSSFNTIYKKLSECINIQEINQLMIILN